jgi:hypothetical protein
MKKILFLLLITSLVISCAETPDWSDKKDNIPPGHVQNPLVENINGGAIITYNLPDDKDILAVKAIYNLKGREVEIYSSAYRDTIKVEGFGDTKEQLVKLVCIDKSFNESIPVYLQINPRTPPVELIAESMVVNETFGGIYVEWDNSFRTDLALTLFAEDSEGEMKEDYTYYSNSPTGRYSFRGFDDQTRKFKIVVKDQWDNQSFWENTLSPLFEEEIKPYNENGELLWNLKYFEAENLYTGDFHDYRWGDNTRGLQLVVAGNTVGNSVAFWLSMRGFLSRWDPTIQPNSENDIQPIPNYWTIDLGEEVSLSRHIYWSRGRDVGADFNNPSNRYYYTLPQGPKRIEIWGTNDKPKSATDFNNRMEGLQYWTSWEQVGGTDAWKEDWIKLGENDLLPPSGAQNQAQVTMDDLIHADNGFTAEIYPEMTNKKIRYIRLVFEEYYSANPNGVHIVGIKFYGAYSNR